MPFCPVNQRIPRLSNVAVLRFALPVEGAAGSRERRWCRVDSDDRVEPAVGHPRGAVGPDDDAVRRRPVAERDLRRLPRRRVEPAELARRLGRVPDRPVGRRRDVVWVRARGHGVLRHLQSGRRRRGRSSQRPPLPRQDASDDAEVTVAERPEDDRLALLERLPRRLLDDDVVCDEHVDLPRRRPRAEQPARVADLLPPGRVVLGRDRVQQRRVHGRAPEREPRGLERTAVGAR